MQPLPGRCVAPQLQPTGLYGQNQFELVFVHVSKIIHRETKRKELTEATQTVSGVWDSLHLSSFLFKMPE